MKDKNTINVNFLQSFHPKKKKKKEKKKEKCENNLQFLLQFAQVTSGKYWRCIPRAVHGVVRPVLEGFFAPHLQGRFFLIPDRTSSVKGWELVYTRCDAIHRFDAVSSVNFSFFQVPNTMQLTTPNHIMLIKKNPNILYKK